VTEMTEMKSNDREREYTKILMGLMLSSNQFNGFDIWNLKQLDKFKIMIKLYLIDGEEFEGEIMLEEIQRKFVYRLSTKKGKTMVAILNLTSHDKESCN